MKKAMVAALALVLLGICPKERSRAQESGQGGARALSAADFKSGSGTNPRFYEVGAKLDPGGDFYLYVDVKDFLRDLMDKIKPIFQGAVTPPQIAAIAEGVDSAIGGLGLYDIQDLGLSGLATRGGLYRSKAFLRIPEERKGLFEMLGPAPHAIEPLEYAPADTALFYAFDLDLSVALDTAGSVAGDVTGEPGREALNGQIDRLGVELGIDFNALIRSTGGDFALLLGLDPFRRMTIPAGNRSGKPHEVPLPRVAIMARAKDATLYETIVGRLKAQQQIPVTETTGGAVRMLRIQVPEIPVYPMTPVLAWDGRYVILTTHGDHLSQMLATKQNGGGLGKQPEFLELAAKLPKQANSMSFQSKRVGEEIGRLYQWFMAQTAEQGLPGGLNLSATNWIFSSFEGARASVRLNDPQGLWWISLRTIPEGEKGGSLASANVLSLAVAPVAVLTAIAVPGFLRARETAQANACIENLNKISGAKTQWALENKKRTGAVVTLEELAPGPGGWLTRVPECPAGGSYTENPIGTDPECSLGGAGHTVRRSRSRIGRATAAPGSFGAREAAQANACIQNLHKVSGAKTQWAFDNRKSTGVTVTLGQLAPADGSGLLRAAPRCPAGGTYTENPIGTDPTCSIGGRHTLSFKGQIEVAAMPVPTDKMSLDFETYATNHKFSAQNGVSSSNINTTDLPPNTTGTQALSLTWDEVNGTQWGQAQIIVNPRADISDKRLIRIWAKGSFGGQSVTFRLLDGEGTGASEIDFKITTEWAEYELVIDDFITAPNDPRRKIQVNWANVSLIQLQPHGRHGEFLFDDILSVPAPSTPFLTEKIPAPGTSVETIDNVTVTFNNPVTGVVAADLTVNGAPADTLQTADNVTYTFTGFAAPAPGDLAIALAAGRATSRVTAMNFEGDAWICVLVDKSLARSEDIDDEIRSLFGAFE